MTLLDGRTVDQSNIFFDDTNYSFKLGGTGEDITTLLRQSDKRQFNGFDVSVYNDIVYAQKYYREHGSYPAQVGSTSTFVNFVQQIATDPLGAPLDALSDGVNQIVKNSGFQKIAIALVAVVVLVLIVKE